MSVAPVTVVGSHQGQKTVSRAFVEREEEHDDKSEQPTTSQERVDDEDSANEFQPADRSTVGIKTVGIERFKRRLRKKPSHKVIAARAVYREQKKDGYRLPRTIFRRLVQEITSDVWIADGKDPDAVPNWQRSVRHHKTDSDVKEGCDDSALDALQKAAETYLVDLFTSAEHARKLCDAHFSEKDNKLIPNTSAVMDRHLSFVALMKAGMTTPGLAAAAKKAQSF